MFSRERISRYKLTSNEFFENPHALWAQMHRDGPVFRSRMPFFGKVWFATSWQATSEVLKDESRFARDVRRAGRKRQLPFLFELLSTQTFRKLAENNILTSDLDDHRRLRNLVEEVFRRSEIDQLVPSIESYSDEFIGQMLSLIHI